MGLKFLLKKFKGLKVKRLLSRRAIENKAETQRIWTGVSHGLHMVDKDGDGDGAGSAISVIAQREKVDGSEFWLYGAHDQEMGSGITKYIQLHLFDNNLTEGQIRRRGKGIMKKAYVSSKANMREGKKEGDIGGSTSMLVINGQSFIAAYCGGYRAVVCRDGKAVQLGVKNLSKIKGKWIMPDAWNMKFTPSSVVDMTHRSSKLTLTARKVDKVTELIILASDGIWQVMRNQEAVDLIAHIQDAQKAAECLAEEALNRMSKSTISCIVVRFH